MDNEGYCCDDRDNTFKKTRRTGTFENPSEYSKPSVNSTRSTIAQCFATFVNSISFVSLGLLCTTPTIVVESVHKGEGELTLSDEEISWYASLLPIFQPFGCFMGGVLQSYIGRKQGLVLMNVSTIVAWILLYKAMSVKLLYVSSALMGISIGFSEAPGITYICEIATPHLRGMLVTYNVSNAVFGIMLTFLLASFMHWKTLCLFCMGLCVSSILLLFFIPDSPIWLINKSRKEEAVKALCWLRGWVSEACVKEEFADLCQLIEKSCDRTSPNGNSSWKRKLKIDLLLERTTFRPFVFLLCYSFFACAAAIMAARNYYLVIFNSLNLPVNSTWLAFLSWMASLVGNIVCFSTVKLFGKRSLSLASMFSCSSLSLLMGLYIAFQRELKQPWIFVVLIICMGFTQCLGISTLPWVLLGEIYPIRNRSLAAGITGATFYVTIFIYVKTYYYLQELITVQGTFLLYSVIGFIGFIYLWKYMPETEGKTITEIEQLFLDDARKPSPTP